jgi:hypothetical protein
MAGAASHGVAADSPPRFARVARAAVIDRFINQCWNLFAVDYAEDYEMKEAG